MGPRRGLDAMRGFEFGDTPDRPVTGSDTLRMGGHDRHHPSRRRPHRRRPHDLVAERARSLRGRPARRGRCHYDGKRELEGVAQGPGHDRPPGSPVVVPVTAPSRHARVISSALTRRYVTGLQADMRAAVEKGSHERRDGDLPPADEKRPVPSRPGAGEMRARVYLEEERATWDSKRTKRRGRRGRRGRRRRKGSTAAEHPRP